MVGRKDGWTDGRMDEWTDGWMEWDGKLYLSTVVLSSKTGFTSNLFFRKAEHNNITVDLHVQANVK